MTGTVKRIHHTGRFGFISGFGGEEFFFHVNSCRNGALPPIGSDVNFLVVKGEKGPQCADVQPVRLRHAGAAVNADAPRHTP